MQEFRFNWSGVMIGYKLSKGYTNAWYARNVVWFDPGSKIIPGTAKKAFDLALADKGAGKRWISKNSRANSKNLRAPGYSRQKSWGDERLWYMLLVTRGLIHIEFLGTEWKENGEGQALFIRRLRGILLRMLGQESPLPVVCFTDRGPGFYAGANGNIVKKYQEALTEEGFRLGPPIETLAPNGLAFGGMAAGHCPIVGRPPT